MIEKSEQIVIVSAQMKSLISPQISTSFNASSISSSAPSQNPEESRLFSKDPTDKSTSEICVEQQTRSVEVKYTLEDGNEVEIDFQNTV